MPVLGSSNPTANKDYDVKNVNGWEDKYLI